MRRYPPSQSLIGQSLTGLHEFPQLNTVRLNARTSCWSHLCFWLKKESSTTDNFLRPHVKLTADQMCVNDSRSAITGLNAVCAARPAASYTNVVSEHTAAVQ